MQNDSLVNSSSTQTSNARLHVVDALRGFALAGIIICHMLEQYMATLPPPGFFDGLNTSVIDAIIGPIDWIFLRGKFFALFSILFGLSFFIQMDSAERKGVNYHGRFVWRLALLLVIGFLHNLFYRGDILVIYAVLGIPLVACYKLSNKAFFWIMAFIFAGGFRYLIFFTHGTDTIIPGGSVEPDEPALQAYIAAITQGSLGDVFYENAFSGMLAKFEFQISIFGRLYLTFAYFLIGLWLGRLGIFNDIIANKAVFKTWLKRLGIAFAICLPIAGFVIYHAFMKENAAGFDSFVGMVALTMYQLVNLTMTGVYLCLFLLAFATLRGQKVLLRLAPFGRMALTNYVTQSMIGTFIFFNWGLGYIAKLSHHQGLVIALVILIVQLKLSSWWLKRFQFGPLEWLWRCGTKLQQQPFSKQQTSKP
ncbi:DUF418 domain-containing protein [Thalassotalea sp. Y01]|uniref:DUF418 domain-containing protein n=1 Tax=Thalassotalea sp. Y01 TaxID=2729613 RepID=UPI00145F8116|nr:DUF418 domain-containing protein [Thalassotalea sp. Y01]NMP15596.1 DUF418 domain-containing protein [Thalassotalea sp. Y01]